MPPVIKTYRLTNLRREQHFAVTNMPWRIFMHHRRKIFRRQKHAKPVMQCWPVPAIKPVGIDAAELPRKRQRCHIKQTKAGTGKKSLILLPISDLIQPEIQRPSGGFSRLLHPRIGWHIYSDQDAV